MDLQAVAGAIPAAANVHDDFLQLFKEEGLEDLAREVGILQNGEIPALKQYRPAQPLETGTGFNGAASSSMTANNANTTSQAWASTTATGHASVTSTAAMAATKQQGKGKAKANSTEAGHSQWFKKAKPAESNKAFRGLRHSSMRVLQKVEEKGRTTYNEVADELVEEYTQLRGLSASDQVYEGKNIRRRVYDILNVLIAMDIICKDKKEITWRGMPSDTESELRLMQRKRRTLLRSIQDKRRHLSDLLLQQIALQNLAKRNTQRTHVTPMDQRVPLPFIVVNTNRKTVIECEMADNRTDIFFNFNAPFEIHDDNEVLKRMGMQDVENLTLDDSFPSSLSWCLPPHVREAVDSASAANKERAAVKTDWWPDELTEAADSAVKEMAAAQAATAAARKKTSKFNNKTNTTKAGSSNSTAASNSPASTTSAKSSGGVKKTKTGGGKSKGSKSKSSKATAKKSKTVSATAVNNCDDDDDEDGKEGGSLSGKRVRSPVPSGKAKPKRVKR